MVEVLRSLDFLQKGPPVKQSTLRIFHLRVIHPCVAVSSQEVIGDDGELPAQLRISPEFFQLFDRSDIIFK